MISPLTQSRVTSHLRVDQFNLRLNLVLPVDEYLLPSVVNLSFVAIAFSRIFEADRPRIKQRLCWEISPRAKTWDQYKVITPDYNYNLLGGCVGCRVRIIGWISLLRGKFMDKNALGLDVGTKCGHPCTRLDGRIKNDFGCCICMGETQLCTSCEKRRLSEDPVGGKDESVNTPGSRKN